jgi:hypothetical protein
MASLTIEHSGTLRFWGDWFGRPMDNVHIVTEVRLDEKDNKLTLRFSNNEVCTIFDPVNIVSTDKQFCILDASKITWQWYSYGLEHPNNLNLIDYEKVDPSCVVIKTKQGTKKIDPTGFNAIEIC